MNQCEDCQAYHAKGTDCFEQTPQELALDSLLGMEQRQPRVRREYYQASSGRNPVRVKRIARALNARTRQDADDSAVILMALRTAADRGSEQMRPVFLELLNRIEE